MSKTVDERVVSMQFDNRNFEQNARTTMSTLDKLKQKLNLSGAAKGLDEVNKAAGKVNFDQIENAAYRSGFHVQDIWLKTASVFEYQVARKIVNAAQNMFNALFVAPVTDGFKEYEMVLNAVQTTMAGTGKTAEEVEKELQRLDEYADKTVYSTSDMLNNLPKFTNAGVELEKATTAMIGIANATALAGGDASKASIAFYNLGQAIGTGYLTRMDYNSINNAGIATMQWKEAMVEAAIAQGTLTKVGEDAYKAGNKTLTLNQLFIDGLQEQWATTAVMMKVFGDYGDETTEIGEKAYAAAQDIKTFTMMMDSLKATAGTGWKETWQIIFGGLEDAKKFWTGLTNFISNIITTLDDWRNNFLATALQSPFSKISEKLKEIGNVAEKVTKPVQDLSEIVDKVINGDLGNTEERWGKLTEMGYDWVKVQNLVNEKLGCTFRRQESVNETTEEAVENTQELNDALLEEIGLTEEEIEVYKKLQEISERTGIPLEEINGRMLLIESFRNIGKSLVGIFTQLKNAWNDTFSPLRPVQLLNLIDKFHQFTESLKVNHDTSYKLWRTFRGLFAILDLVATITGGAFRIAFEIAKELLKYFNLDILDVTAAVGDAIVRFRNWVKSLIDVEAVVEVIGPLIERAVNSVKNLVKSVKESKAFQTFTARIRSVTTAVREWFVGMKDAENLPQYIAKGIGTAIGYVLKTIRDLVKNVGKFVTGGFNDIGGFITEGFLDGLRDGVGNVWNTIKEFANTIITTVCEILGIESPSKVFFAIGGFAVAGFVLGFRDKIGEVWPALGEFANGVVDFVQKIPFGKIFATAGSIALLSFAKSMMDVAGGISEVLEGVGTVLVSFSYTTKQFGTAIKRLSKAVSNSLNAMAFKQLAISIAILVGSIVVLTLLDPNKMWQAVGVIAALAGIMAALFVVCNLKFKFGKGSLGSETTVIEFGKMAAALFAIGGAIMLMAIAAKMIGGMQPEELEQAKTGLIFLAGIMVGLMAATKLMAKSTSSAQTLAGSTKTTTDIAAIGATLMQIAASLLILVIAAKLIASMEWSEMAKAGAGLLVLGGIMVGLMAATKLLAKTKAGTINSGLLSVGKMLLSIATAMLMLVVAAKIIASMSWADMAKAGAGLIALAGIMVGLVAATQMIVKTAKGGLSTQITKIGTMLLSIAAAMLVLAIAAKIIASMEWADMAKAGVGLLALGGIMVGLIAATKLAGGNDLKGVAVTLLAMAAIIGVMAITAIVMSLIDLGGLAKGVIAMALLGAVVAGMVAATKYAKNVQGTMIGIAIAIAVMAAAIAVLSFIDPASLAAASIALGIVMGMFALMESQAGRAKKAMGAILAMAAVIAVMAAALAILANMPIDGVLGSAIALSLLIGVMAGVMAILSKICGGEAGKNALKGVILLAAMSVPLLAFAAAIALMSCAQNALANAGVLILLATAMTVLLIPLSLIGSALGFTALIGVLALTAMAVPLIAFVGVLAAMSGVQNALTNALTLTILATAMTLLLIPLALIGAGIVPALLGVTALTAMAVPLLAFVGVLMMMEGMENCLANANALVTLVSALTLLMLPLSLIGALAVPALIGIGVLTTMAASLGTFGKGIAGFSDAVAGVNVEAVRAACEAGKAITEMASTVPNQGGIVAWFVGDNSLATFGPQIASFGKHLKSFSDNVAGINPENVKAAAAAGKNLAKMADTIPNSGGVKSWFSGDNSLASFGSHIASFGKHLKTFSDNVTGINPNNIKAASEAGKHLSQMAATIPSKVNLTTFGNSLATFGKNLSSFASEVSNIKIAGLTATITVFEDAMDKIADAGKKGVNGFINEFTNSSGKVKSAATAMVQSALNGVKSQNLKSSFSGVGKDLVNGFASGITAQTWKAQAAASAMASAALQAAKNALKINSPSKVFRDIGTSVPEGFAMGIDKLGGMVKSSAVEMADGAIDGTRDAIARIASAINSDIDTQPTIRPVLDLSDIESGASSLSGMFGMTPSVGVLANVGAISSMMNNRQNGGNDDVVSALNDLKSVLGNRSGDTYSINGITYDDGTNVSEAVKTLVRAARIERRI